MDWKHETAGWIKSVTRMARRDRRVVGDLANRSRHKCTLTWFGLRLKRPFIHEYIYLVSIPLFQASERVPEKEKWSLSTGHIPPPPRLTYERSGSTSATVRYVCRVLCSMDWLFPPSARRELGTNTHRMYPRITCLLIDKHIRSLFLRRIEQDNGAVWSADFRKYKRIIYT